MLQRGHEARASSEDEEYSGRLQRACSSTGEQAKSYQLLAPIVAVTALRSIYDVMKATTVVNPKSHGSSDTCHSSRVNHCWIKGC